MFSQQSRDLQSDTQKKTRKTFLYPQRMFRFSAGIIDFR